MTLPWYPFLSLLERRTPKETLLQPHGRPGAAWKLLRQEFLSIAESPYLVT